MDAYVRASIIPPESFIDHESFILLMNHPNMDVLITTRDRMKVQYLRYENKITLIIYVILQSSSLSIYHHHADKGTRCPKSDL